ncbi:MAG: ankyrin repeat domain-containing protein, partial [Verrucomicrobiota bacterium]
NRGDGIDGLPPPRISGAMTTLDFSRLLIEEYGADPNLSLTSGNAGGPKFGMRGATPFLLACRTADLPYLKVLYQLGADPSIANADETTALLAACGVGSRTPEEEAGTEDEAIEVIEWLFELGSEVNEVNRQKETAMHGAAYRNWPKVVHLLADTGADIAIWNEKNRHRWTPLLIAQGFRPGNFKPDAATEKAIAEVMLADGVEPPPAPERPLVGKPKEYEEP